MCPYKNIYINMKRKKYQEPTVFAISLNVRQHLLTLSQESGVGATMSGYKKASEEPTDNDGWYYVSTIDF